MVKIIKEADCCGCSACKEACPKNCIAMVESTLGALIPSVDESLCVSCGKCDAVCPMLTTIPTMMYKQKAYAAYSKNASVRHEGSSGGLFGTFAYDLIKKGYRIYGAAFNSDLKLKCTSAQSEEELKPLFKSKYLQSDMSGKYVEIEELLKKGEKVMFTSTPCQVFALKKYLGKDYDNLLTVDFFCHGVPSQKFFDECKALFENNSGYKLRGFSFRSKKKNGVTPHYYTATYSNGKKEITETKLYFYSPFYAAFQSYAILRESCYSCRFSNRDRVSDITIADFHTVDRYLDGINRFDGISLVHINTSKGEDLFSKCMDTLVVYPLDTFELEKKGDCFSGGTQRPKKRDNIISDYESKAFSEVVDNHFGKNKYLKNNIYYHLPKCIRKILGKVLFRG